MTGARRAVLAASLISLLGLSAVALNGIYADDLLLRLLLGAAAGSVGLGLALRPAPAWTVGPVSTLALAGYTLLAVRLTAPGAAIIPAAKEALLGQIPRLLTAMIPVEPAPDTVVLPIVAVWVAGLVGAELAIRAGRVLAGYAAPTLVYAGALVVVGPNASQPSWQPVAYVGVAALGLAIGARRASLGAGVIGPQRRPHGLVGGAITAIVLVGAGAALGPALADQVSRQPTDPRKYVQRPELDTVDDNPLIRLSGWAQNPTQRLFDLETSGGDTAHRPDRIRLAVLNDYDGITWRVGATYRAAGRVLPPPPGPVARPRPVTQRITIRELGGRLLPAIAAARRVEGVPVAYDQSSGTLLEPDGARPGARYEVLSERSSVDVNLLPGASAPAGAGIERFLRIGDAQPPRPLQDVADQIEAEAAGPYARASALESFLAEHYTYAPDAPSGHAYPNLTFFLAAKREEGGQRGTSEQFAAAYAVIARMMGLPSRVVVGFRVPSGSGPSPVLAGGAVAWPEVYFDGIGWYPFNPLPQAGSVPQPPEEEFKPEPEPSKKPETNQPIEGTVSAPPTPVAAAPARPATGAADGTPRAIVTAVCAVVVVLSTAVAPALLRRGRRARRLSRGSPSARIAGAWLEVLDALRLAGRRPAPHLPAGDVAALARQPLPGYEPLPPLDDLAALVNLVAFAPHAASDLDAVAARSAALEYVDALRRQHPWWRRLLWSVSPRPLFWTRPHADGPTDGGPPSRWVHARSDSART